MDAIGDIFIVLAIYCSNNNIDMEKEILTSWESVNKRTQQDIL